MGASYIELHTFDDFVSGIEGATDFCMGLEGATQFGMRSSHICMGAVHISIRAARSYSLFMAATEVCMGLRRLYGLERSTLLYGATRICMWAADVCM